MIAPDGLDVVSWTDQVSISLSRYGIVGQLDNPALWREWATQVQDLPTVRDFSPPDPNAFALWSDWADRFNQTVDYGA